MKKSKTSLPVLRIIIALLALCVVIVLIKITYNSSDHTFVLPDKTISQGEVQLCSPYANLCFTRPANWTRSSILHVNGKANDTIEINPPTGTILEFAKSSNATAANCDKTAYKDCVIKVAKVTQLENGLSVVTGMLIDSPDANCADSCSAPRYTPFVTLLSESDFTKYKLGSDTSTFDTFNPRVLVKNGQSAYLQVTPGKEFSVDAANQWQNSTEAKAAQQILASATLYKQ